MITFNTQEEFEDAVMQVLSKRLVIELSKNYEGDLAASLKDREDYLHTISTDWVSI